MQQIKKKVRIGCILLCFFILFFIIFNKENSTSSNSVVVSKNGQKVQESVGDTGTTYVIPIDQDTATKITDDDDYMNRKIIIKIYGLKAETIKQDGIKQKIENKLVSLDQQSALQKAEVSYTHEGSGFTGVITLSMDNVYAYSYNLKDKVISLKIKKPKDAYDKVVVVDAGHGGKDCGAGSNYYKIYEKNVTLAVVQKMKKLFDKQDKVKVYYTRLTDMSMKKKPRVDLANTVNADLFLSVHCNSTEDCIAFGTTVLYSNKLKNVLYSSKSFANNVLVKMADATQLKNRGVENREDLYVLNHTNMPSALVETAFISYLKERDFLVNPKNQDKMAQAIYDGILQTLDEM